MPLRIDPEQNEVRALKGSLIGITNGSSKSVAGRGGSPGASRNLVPWCMRATLMPSSFAKCAGSCPGGSRSESSMRWVKPSGRTTPANRSTCARTVAIPPNPPLHRSPRSTAAELKPVGPKTGKGQL